MKAKTEMKDKPQTGASKHLSAYFPIFFPVILVACKL